MCSLSTLPEIELLCWDMIEDGAASRPQHRAEGLFLIIRCDLHQAGFVLHLDLGIKYPTVLLTTLEGVGLRSRRRKFYYNEQVLLLQ